MLVLRLLSGMVVLSHLLFSAIILPESFSSDFTQMITNTKGKVLHYRGRVLFSGNTLFKWRYMEPTKKEVCTNGKELLVVDHDLEQVSAYYLSKGLDIAKVLKRAKVYRNNIYLAQFDEKQYTIQLDNQQRLQSIAYFDDLDNKVQIVFRQMHYSKKKVPEQEMKCNYPDSYDVIRG